MSNFRNAIESLEGRQLMASVKGTDVKIIAASDLTKDNGNDLVVKFNAPISSFDISKMRMFGYANNTLLGGQVKTTINIKSGSISGSNLTLRTDVMIRKGSTLTLNAGAVTDAQNASPAASVKVAKGLNRDRFTLALRAFSPKDKTYFSSAILTGGSAPLTLNTAPTDAAVRTQLDAFLQKKVKANIITAAQKTASMARYDGTAEKALIPAANLRAGVLSLIGTVGEPAIAFYLDKGNTTGKDFIKIAFDAADFSSNARINQTDYTSTGKLRQIWNPNFAGESFVVLSGLLAHETAHEGLEDVGSGAIGQLSSQQEEVIANTIEDMVYAQQVVNDFTYSQQKGFLTLRANYRTLLLLNSGDRQFPRVGIKAAPLLKNGVANPGFLATDYDNRSTQAGKPGQKSFQADVTQEFIFRNVPARDATNTYPTVRAILTKITGNTYTTATKFGNALIDDVDIGQDTIADAYAMRVARVLQVSA
jgi:hypothetical protein